MNPGQLLAHFDRISTAPDAIPRLRRFILDLAVRGKLVEHNPCDEHVSELLKRVLAEREQRNGRTQDQSSPEVTNQASFQVPGSWQWVRLGGIARVVMGQSPPGETYNTTGDGTPLINGPVEFTEGPFGKTIVNQYTTAPTNMCEAGDLLLCVRGSTTGRTNIAAFRACIGRGVAAIHSTFDDSYVRLSIWRLRESIIAMGRGVAFPSVSRKQIEDLPIPLPPLAEQHRIVTKVGELMALCDRLEAAQAERERRRDRLAAASLQRLNPPADSAFREHADFHLRHLSRLTTRPDQISALRQTILNLAVRGQLVATPNWPAKPKPLGEFAALQNGYAFKSEWFVRSGIRLLRNANVSHGLIRWDDLACLPEDRAQEFERFQLNVGDVVLSLDRPFIVTGTKVARVRAEDLPCLLLQRVGRFQPQVERLSADYLFLWLHSPHFTDQIDPGRSNGVPHISSRQVEAAQIFVPTLAEQHRIVTKVEELMALCDRLESQLTAAQTESRRLLEAVLHQALAPTV